MRVIESIFVISKGSSDHLCNEFRVMILDILFYIAIGLILLSLLVVGFIYIVAKLVEQGFRAREDEAQALLKQLLVNNN